MSDGLGVLSGASFRLSMLYRRMAWFPSWVEIGYQSMRQVKL